MNEVNQESTFRVSQGYDVIPPRPGRAYPILCEEWDYLKSKISQISDEALTFHTVGWLLLGTSLSSFIAILTGSFTPAQNASPTRLTVAWAALAVALVCGLLSLYFAREQRQVTRVKSSDVLKQMELIEKRYEAPPAK